MKTFTIEWIEEKQSAKGNTYYKASLIDQDGHKTDGVTIFSSFKGDLRPGSVVEGTLKAEPFKGKMTYTLEGERTSRGSRGTTPIARAVAQKGKDNIAQAQERKGEAIMVSATARDATLITVALVGKLKDVSSDEFHKIWKEERQWLVENWDIDPTDGQAF